MVELLIVLVVLPIVVGAVAYALIATFALQNGASNRLANSDDAQNVSSTFEKDVQSATYLTTQNGSQYQCGVGGIQLLGLRWSQASEPMVVVSYEEVGSSAPYDLVRNYCIGGSSTPSTSSTLSFNLPSSQPPPSYNCAAGCTPNGGGWISTTGVSDVTFTIDETSSSTKVGDFAYSLIATPRTYLDQPSGSGGGGSPIYPLALLDEPDCANNPAPTLDMTGASTLTVKGSSGLLPIFVASSCPQAITMIPGQSLVGQVSSIITNDTNTSTPGEDTYCVLANKNKAGCNAADVGPTESAPTSAVVDPLSSLAPPPNPTLPGDCLNQACAQGEEFSSPQTLTSSFGTAGDTYIFDGNVTISNNVTVDFAPGTYWFKGGLTMAQSTVFFGTGTYLFGNATSDTCPGSTCFSKTNGGTVTTDNTGGVLFYVETGAVTINGSSQVSVSAAQPGYPLYSQYGEVALWDNSTAPLSITNGASSTDTFSGIYDPYGEVILSGSGAMTISFVEASTASLAGSGALTLGQ